MRWAIVLSIIIAAGAAQAAGSPTADPNWPCRRAKIVDFPLASIWDGPEIPLTTANWRDDPETAALVEKMARRRVPVEDVRAGVEKTAKPKIAVAFGVAFQDLVRQRAEILNGLDRFGRHQREMAERIRAENETAHAGANPDEAALQKLQWDLRLYDERRRTISFVCEAPAEIETRIGDLAKIVRSAL